MGVGVAEGRFVSRSIAQSYDLASVSLEAAFLFTWCIPHLDRDGRMAGDPELVRSIVCPLRPELDVDTIACLIGELAEYELVEWYRWKRRHVLAFPGFAKHQRGLRYDREKESRFPPPDASGCTPADIRMHSGNVTGCTPDDVSEVKGSEVEVKTTTTARAGVVGEPHGMESLRSVLGTSFRALEKSGVTVRGSSTWPSAIVGMYGPDGTKRHVLSGLDDEEVGAVLAESIVSLAGEKSGQWRQPFFDSIVSRVVRQRRNGVGNVDGWDERHETFSGPGFHAEG